jgi:two-component system KDP operon response regulator KdpE
MANGVPARILLVEDDEINRALLRAVLSTAAPPALQGAVLTEAGSLAEARASFSAQHADMILLDVQLPDGSGLELAAELSQSDPPPVIVALSAGVLPAQRRDALAAGCRAFDNKPYTASQLLSVIIPHLPAHAVPSPAPADS